MKVLLNSGLPEGRDKLLFSAYGPSKKGRATACSVVTSEYLGVKK
jgi:hypothetical protein